MVRGIGAPSVTGHSVDVVVVGTDTSGSIFADKTLLERFIGETAGILEDLNPREVHWVECDVQGLSGRASCTTSMICGRSSEP